MVESGYEAEECIRKALRECNIKEYTTREYIIRTFKKGFKEENPS